MVWSILKWQPNVGWNETVVCPIQPYFALAKCSLYQLDPVLGTHFKFSFDEIEEMVKQAEVMRVFVASSGVPPPPVAAVGNKGTRVSDLWLIHALEQHPIVDMHVVSVHVGMRVHACTCRYVCVCMYM